MIKLPASSTEVLQTIMIPTFARLLPGMFDSPAARVLLLAIRRNYSDVTL